MSVVREINPSEGGCLQVYHLDAPSSEKGNKGVKIFVNTLGEEHRPNGNGINWK